MDIIFWLPDSYPVLLRPSVLGVLGWFVLLATVVWTVWSWRHFQTAWQGRTWGLFLILLALQVVFVFSPGLRLPIGAAPPVPNSPQELKGPALMLLSAIPWMLAGGMLGPLAAALVGLAAGLLRFLWDSHSIFTPLELALLGALFSLAVRQRFRTRLFRLLGEPFSAALALAILYVPIYIFDAFLVVSDPNMAVRLDYAISSAFYAILAVSAELLVGGLFAQVLAVALPGPWGRRLPLQPSPTERSLEARFLLGTGSLIIALLIALLVGDWIVAGRAAREMLGGICWISVICAEAFIGIMRPWPV